jgi:hypothetical protein
MQMLLNRQDAKNAKECEENLATDENQMHTDGDSEL